MSEVPQQTRNATAAPATPAAGRATEIALHGAAEARLHRRAWWLGMARLLVFAAVLVFVVHAVRTTPGWLLRGAAPGAVLFAALVAVHARVRAAEERARRRRILAEESLARLRGAWGPGATPHSPRPSGSALDAGRAALVDEGEHHELDPWVREDLGVDGTPPSLLDLLNTTQSSLGALRLRVLLRTPLLEAAAIRARQEASAELAEKKQWRDALMLALFHCRTLRLQRVPAFLARRAELPTGWIRVVLAVCGALVPLLLVLGARWSLAWTGAAAAFLPLFALSIGLRRRSGSLRESWLEVEPLLQTVHEVARVLVSMTPQSALLRRQQEAFAGAIGSGRGSLPRTLRLLRLLHLHDVGFLYGIVELMTSWDLHWLLALDARLRREPGAFERLVIALCDLEALTALAVFQAEQPGLCLPELLEAEPPSLEIEGGVHPFLPAEQAVPNALRLTGTARLAVITGSNMAGKSTYLRMVALNSVLAQIGAPARAARLRCTPLRLYANINVRDSLADGKSYFLVEVERVLGILQGAAAHTHVLGLFDELFRGTNSPERLAASRAVAEWLLARGGLFMLATHEQELARLAAEQEGIVALHFGEEIHAGRLVFPYRVQDGISTSHNALRWLELCGYPAELVQHARAQVQSGNPGPSAGEPAQGDAQRLGGADPGERRAQ